MKNTKITKVEKELFPIPKTTAQSIRFDLAKQKMKDLGGNWKRITFENCIVWVSDEGKCISSIGNEIAYSIQNNGYVSYRTTTVHRLVAFAFGLVDSIKNDPDNPIDIDHIDNDKTNNKLSNLRAISHEENIKKRDVHGHVRATAIDCYDYETSKFLKTYNSLIEAANELGLKSPNIHYCLTKEHRQTKGYSFRYHGEKYVKVMQTTRRDPVDYSHYVYKSHNIKHGRKPREERNYAVNHPNIEVYKDGVLVDTLISYNQCAIKCDCATGTVRNKLLVNDKTPINGYTFKFVEE